MRDRAAQSKHQRAADDDVGPDSDQDSVIDD